MKSKPPLLKVVILKPSKYGKDGHVERFRRGFMPNSTIIYIKSMTLQNFPDIEVATIDEYVETDLDYLKHLQKGPIPTLLALVGVQSHQFQRALDLAAYALAHGVEHCVVGGPHPMTCDTSMLQGRGVSFALAEAERIWPSILDDAINGKLQPVYGEGQRWEQELHAPVLVPPSPLDLRRYILPMAGVYPARGCPFTCNFCSVIKIAGRQIRSQDIGTTMLSLHAMKQAGIRLIMFASDNFNKYPEAPELLERMVDEKIEIPFFVQCDAQVGRDEAFIELLGRAKCFQMFVGVESFNRKTLLAAHKAQNHPETYSEIIRLCRKHGITTHFSNIIGFPGQSVADVREHVDVLKSLDPDVASFYILTPVPGTEQYGEFLEKGLIWERNLDRFDATCPVWNHDVMSNDELQDLLFECYRRFYSAGKSIRLAIQGLTTKGNSPGSRLQLGHPIFVLYCAWKKMHPMSGGVGREERDHLDEYLEYRLVRFGYPEVPLPRNLELSETDARMNRRVKVSL